MQEELIKTIGILSRLNDSCRKKIISQEELEEQMANLEEFTNLVVELRTVLSKLDGDKHSVGDVVENLLQLHLKYSDYIWHIDQIHELIKKMAGNYRDSY
ncbi:hypothetical protein [Brevibacillus laterosporus]|uniref:Uncharacterized protein n=1 Tax=Brevibacillus laterosporus LMG 15441 TaxID=1042163 RepID=A0A075R5Z8_BRELA|nr:hypothetical protein [Brevibacillus laterosporus]AIG26583.1 hypothetical protein BRLA_c022620 [Brevibacillus laterosporus LMG 15441]RJL14163.1 hypothetical protein DM460_05060 [Brevibacillus laterosporus]